MDNRDIAAVLREIAVFSDLSGANPFKARAFETVARTVEKLPESLADLAAKDRLAEVKGIGKGTEQVIRELLATGASTELAKLKAGFPPGITDLLALPGMGPKRVKTIHERLGVSSIEALEVACRDGRVAGLEGFGEKTQANILKAVEFLKTTSGQRLFGDALAIGEDLVELCRASGHFARTDIAGSLRRGKHVFKDIDILLVPARDDIGDDIRSFLATLADPDSLIGAGPTKVSIRRAGLPVDFRVVPPASWPAALQHFTGSKEHNTALRSRAKSLGLKGCTTPTAGLSRSTTKQPSTGRSGSCGFRPRSARPTARSRPPRRAPSPPWSNRRRSGAWCTFTRRGPTGGTRSRRWRGAASPGGFPGCA
jgi:DNA polymerase (family 10)